MAYCFVYFASNGWSGWFFKRNKNSGFKVKNPKLLFSFYLIEKLLIVLPLLYHCLPHCTDIWHSLLFPSSPSKNTSSPRNYFLKEILDLFCTHRRLYRVCPGITSPFCEGRLYSLVFEKILCQDDFHAAVFGREYTQRKKGRLRGRDPNWRKEGGRKEHRIRKLWQLLEKCKVENYGWHSTKCYSE